VIRDMLDNARRSGDRIGVDGIEIAPTQLAAEIIRLARVATSIHLADAARLRAEHGPAPDRLLTMRELRR
jgi:hypothetical protein